MLTWHCGKVGGNNITPREGQKSQPLTQSSLTVVWGWGASVHLGEDESPSSWSDYCRLGWDRVFSWWLAGEDGLSKIFQCYYVPPFLVPWIKRAGGRRLFICLCPLSTCCFQSGIHKANWKPREVVMYCFSGEIPRHSAFFSVYQSPPMFVHDFQHS